MGPFVVSLLRMTAIVILSEAKNLLLLQSASLNRRRCFMWRRIAMRLHYKILNHHETLKTPDILWLSKKLLKSHCEGGTTEAIS
ncbi:MAG: hypothetical protein KGJ87_06570 [Planctomycetota bacterium]|nr:hypothetical protein [Planctomycetota bacterium]MDE2216807.1 hypothetical protein [Planctomycetota bacterium]